MDYVPLEETSKPLSIRQLALRWYSLFPEEFSIEFATSESHALSIIEKSIGVFLKANDRRRLSAVIKQEFRPKRGGYVIGGIDGVHRERPLVSISVYYFDPVEVNRFEAECFIKPSQYKSQLVMEGGRRLDSLKKKAFLDLVREIEEMERKSNFPTAEEFIEQQPKYIEVPDEFFSMHRLYLERASQQQRIADMQEEKLELELRELKSKGTLSLRGNPEAQRQWMLNYEAENNIDTSKPLADEVIQAYETAAIKAGMTTNSFRDRCRERDPKVQGIDRRKLKK